MKWIAHRGLSALFPENTMPAFEAAREHDCDGIETDVQLSSDGFAVLTHDRLEGPAADEHVRLAAFLAAFPDLELLVEAKVFDDTDHEKLLDAILPLLRKHLDHVFLLCFDVALLRAAHRRCPELRCVLNRSNLELPDDDLEFLHAYSVNIDALNEGFERGNKVLMAWTCNTREQFEKAGLLKIDVLMSDKPPKSCIEIQNKTR